MRWKLQHHEREIKIDSNFIPCELQYEEECYANGFFHFNISRIIEDIESGKLVVAREQIDVEHWHRRYGAGVINEDHMPNVVLSKPVIQAEIRHDMFEIIEGHHRIEKAHREGVAFIDSYKLIGEQLPQYLTSVDRYKSYINYWNDKLQD